MEKKRTLLKQLDVNTQTWTIYSVLHFLLIVASPSYTIVVTFGINIYVGYVEKVDTGNITSRS